MRSGPDTSPPTGPGAGLDAANQPGRDPGVFLEKRSYRRRRVLDAFRLLPIVGLWLWMLPLLWPAADEGAALPMSSALSYVFGVWILLIVLSFGLVRLLGALSGDPAMPPQPGAAADRAAGAE